MLRGRRLVRNCGCRWCGQRHQTRMGARAGAPFAKRSSCLHLTPAHSPEGRAEARRSRPRNSTVPPAGQSKRRADLGERAGGAVTPARGSSELGCSSAGGPPSHGLFHAAGSSDNALSPRGADDSSLVLPAERAAGQSSRARSGAVTHGSIAGSSRLALSRGRGPAEVPKIALSRGFLGGVRPWRASVRPCSSTARCGVDSVGSRRTA